MMRTAISPRLAIRTRRNGGVLRCAPSLRKDGAASERDVPMLLPWVRVALVLEDLERPDEARARLGWLDDLVDIAARRCDVRVRELGFVGSDQSRSFGRRIIGGGDGVLEDDAH